MKNKLFCAMMALLVAGCGYVENRTYQKERSEKLYLSAMDAYRAGRLQDAIKGLEETCTANPANSSARFQLACLLQDHAKDYFAAACAYREYLLQQPGSDKAKLAEDLFAECEKELAKALAAKYGFNAASAADGRLKELSEARKKAEENCARLDKELQELKHEIVVLTAENARLKAVFGDAEEDTSENLKKSIDEAKNLADGERETVKPQDNGIAAAKQLLADEDAEETPLIVQAPDAKEKRAAAEAERKAKEAAEAERMKAKEHPDTYVVQEGDTLYKIAIRFYGRASAWSRIREANKAAISTDGRVYVGQKIVLPK